MKTLFLDLQNGIAGDMLVAALLDLFEDPQALLQELKSLGLPVDLELVDSEKCGILGKRFIVRVGDLEEGEGGGAPHFHPHKEEGDLHVHSHSTQLEDHIPAEWTNSDHRAPETQGDVLDFFAEGGKRVASFVTGLVDALHKSFEIEDAPVKENADSDMAQYAAVHAKQNRDAKIPHSYASQDMYDAFHDPHEPLGSSPKTESGAVEMEIILKASREMVSQLKKVFDGLGDIVLVEERDAADSQEAKDGTDRGLDFELLIRGGKELADRVAKLGKKALQDAHHEHFSAPQQEQQGHDGHHPSPVQEPSHAHSHRSFSRIKEILEGLALTESVKQRALSVYQSIAEAEAKVHGCPVSRIHFHEVGDWDAIADIVCASYLLDKLEVEQVVASPINTGSGTVHCAHGILPVPAPATLELLQGIPVYAARAQSELCTPTGAALAKEFVTNFGAMPVLLPKKIGYGMGKKDFPFANCLRAILAESEELRPIEEVELACNLDDMSPEALAFACEMLSEKGALEVWTSPIYMKKGRLGTELHLICKKEDKEAMLAAIFQYSSTIGLREYPILRHKLRREMHETEAYGETVRYKKSKGYGTEKRKYEYEDLARIARAQGLSIEEVRKHVEYLDAVSAWV